MARQNSSFKHNNKHLNVSDTAIKLSLQTDHEPLYKRVPRKDEDGNHLSDFMMLIPGLRQRDQVNFSQRIDLLHAILGRFDEVVFADLNVPLNLLWVSVRSRAGVTNDLSQAIRQQIPEARIIGHTTITATDSKSTQHSSIESRKKQRIKSPHGFFRQ